MKKAKKRFALLMAGVLCLGLTGCGGGERVGLGGAPHDDAPSVSAVRQVGKLQLAEMTISKMGTIEDLKLSDAHGVEQTAKALLNSMKIGERKGAYSYDTYLRAYIDLSKLSADDFEVDSVARVCRVRMPKVEVEFAGREPSMHEEHYRVTGLRSDISAQERAALKEEMNRVLRQEVEKNPTFARKLRERAEGNARAWFESYFASMGYSGEISE